MQLHHQHPWDLSTTEAKVVQEKLSQYVICQDQLPAEINLVAGVDAGFENKFETIRVAVAVLSFPELEVVETKVIRRPTTFPYVPGFLSFRELPAIVDALGEIKNFPDLILCDGQGYAHPRRFGLACHLGVLLDCPTIGVAKSRYIGKHDELSPEKGEWVDLIDKDERIGAVLRTRKNVRPLYISCGHRISLKTAIAYVLACTPKYRLPETTRIADHLASHATNI
ncbi:endonuclease V [[Limnothrix rosea] IAM M-220]|nr:endonuclease V [[Limnothrix rosea] IAM M-220]